MRTTIDLPDDLHRAALALAHDRHQSLSRTVAEIMRRGLAVPQQPSAAPAAQRDGFPLFHTDRVITSEDVRALDDDE
ncbi:antitoxin [Angustibacter sp. McL0619]|uniref:antitoxin n=1 Tax=Angustibacter sp. McL0619 TaxID=3415676 RepID=UPI003CE889EF